MSRVALWCAVTCICRYCCCYCHYRCRHACNQHVVFILWRIFVVIGVATVTVAIYVVNRSEWILHLRGRITYRHCRQSKLLNFLYSSTRLFGGGAADAGTAAPSSAYVWRRYRNDPRTGLDTNCRRLMQWNGNGISGKITELLTFLHSNNVNITATFRKAVKPSDQMGCVPSTSGSSLKVPSTISLTSSICQSQLDRYLKYGTKRWSSRS